MLQGLTTRPLVLWCFLSQGKKALFEINFGLLRDGAREYHYGFLFEYYDLVVLEDLIALGSRRLRSLEKKFTFT